VTAVEQRVSTTDAAPGDETTPAAGLSDRALAGIVALVTLPILWMGYGTDIDVHNVLRAADGIRHGDYMPSRTPGVPVFEAITAVFDPVGGHLLLNLLSAAAAAAAVVGLARLVRLWGHANGDLVALALFASPLTIIAATSLVDFIWALVFFVWAAVAYLRDGRGSTWIAAVLFGLSIGCRLSSAFLIVAFLVADGWDPAHRRRALWTGLVGLPLGALMFVPSWLAYDRTFEFLHNEQGYRSLSNNLGRFAYKSYSATGLALLVVFAIAVPALWAALRRWRDDPMLRFAVLGFVGSEALYFVMPWKMAHLLPSLLTALLWVGASRLNQRRYLWLVVAAVAINGVVSFRVLTPNETDESTGGHWSPTLGLGLLANDIDCRLTYMDQTPAHAADRAWACTLKPMRGPTPEDQIGKLRSS
jgi:hypothetical protein